MNLVSVIKKFNWFFERQQKIKIIIIGIMMVIGAGLETLGVSLVLPLISMIMDPQVIYENEIAAFAMKLFHIHSEHDFIVLLILTMIAVFIFKNVYLLLEYYIQNRFVSNCRFRIQKRLLETYVHRSYEYFLNINLAEITRVMVQDTSNTFEMLTSVLSFFTEAVVTMFLVILIICIDPVMAIMIAVILSCLLIFISKGLMPLQHQAGVNFQENTAKAGVWLTQAVHGIKDVKVSNKEEFFVNEYTKFGKIAIDSEKKYKIFLNLPRLLIEAAAMGGMLTVILVLYLRGRELSSMLPQLAAFAMAAVRLLPSVSRMSCYLNSIPYQEVGLDKLMENLYFDQNDNDVKITDKEKIGSEKKHFSLRQSCGLERVHYHYQNSSAEILKGASMEIPVGASVGVVGASGSGKTTAIDILLGLLKPQSGTVMADGKNIEDDYQGWLSSLSYVPQVIYLLDGTIRANVAFGIPEEQVQDEDVWRALKEAMLDEFVDGLPNGLDTQVGERGVRFSGGQRQRIGIARALYINPELLIFDEATSALDNETEADIMKSIHSLHGKKTLVIIAHRLGTIEACDIVYRVENGIIIRER